MHIIERMRIEDENAQIERFMALREEQEQEDAYQAWASDQRDNGEDDSREAWEDHIESRFVDSWDAYQ